MWPRLQLKAGRYFMAVLVIQWLWEWGYLFEANSQSLAMAKFWDDFQFIPYLLLGPAWFYMSLCIADKPLFKGLGHPLFMLALPIFFIIALVFDEQWHWIRETNSLRFSQQRFSYEFGLLIHVSVLWLYSLIFASTSILFSFQRHINKAYRFQLFAVMLGLYMPLIFSLPAVFGYSLFGLKDLTPLSFAVGNLAIVFGLLRMHAFEYQIVSQLPILAQLPVGIIILDHRKRLIEWNELAEQMLAMPLDQPGMDYAQLPFQALLALNEERYWQRDESHYAIQYSPLATQDQLPSWMITIKDISTQHQHQKSLEVTNQTLKDMLNELTEAQDRALESEKHRTLVSLIQSLAHEFNTPLGNLNMLLGCLTDGEDPKEYLDLMQSNISRVIMLIERIKQISAVKTDAEIETFDLQEAIDEVVNLQRYEKTAKGIEITTQISPNVEVHNSRVSIENILLQLIENSRQHAFMGVENPQIRIVATQLQDRLVLEYCDNGIGIPEELESHLFLPFSNSSSHMSISSGIGLFSVHQWVNQSLHGVIQFLRKEQGVCFKITCPLNLQKVARNS